MKTNPVTSKQTTKDYTINCDCGFMVKDHNRNELVEIGIVHARNTHPDKNLGKPQIEGMIKTA